MYLRSVGKAEEGGGWLDWGAGDLVKHKYSGDMVEISNVNI